MSRGASPAAIPGRLAAHGIPPQRSSMPDTTNDPFPTIEEMVAEIRSAPAIYQPSAFWEELCATNLSMLRDHGLDNFKLSLAQNYYNWMVVSRHDPQFRRVMSLWQSHPGPAPLLTRLGRMGSLWTMASSAAFRFGWRERQVYRLFVGLLWDHMLSLDTTGLGKLLEEPLVGNPIPLTRFGRRISQDLANSIIECNTMLGLDPGRPPGVVAELGAGYGRLAHVFLSAPGTRRYCIVDIPPALMVSQWYLGKVLPGRRVFPFRRFTDLSEVWDEYQDSEVAFLTPNQLELFPDGHFDLMLSISTFPEMRREQADHYFALFARLSRSLVFIKQWISWTNPKDHSHFTSDSYRLPPEWSCILDAGDPTMPMFFNKAWKRG